MENVIKILEIFSHNWLIILVLVLTIPLMKMVVRAIVDIKIAQLNNHNKIAIHYENSDLKKTIEISTSELNLEHIKGHLIEPDRNGKLLIETKKNG